MPFTGFKLIKHSNGNVALVIAGETPILVRQRAKSWIDGKALETNWYHELKKGEKAVVTVNGIKYEVELRDVSDTKAAFVVNGESITLAVGWEDLLADGTIFAVTDVGSNTATFYMPSIKNVQSITSTEKLEEEPEEVPEEEYETCLQDLNRLKGEINAYYNKGQEVSQSLLDKYEELSNWCEKKAPGAWPKVAKFEEKEDCIGCVKKNGKSACLQFGIRLVDEKGTPVFCDIDKTFKPQKKLGATGQNNYECLSNTVANGKCISIEERIEAVEKELKKQGNILQKILNFFKSIFKG